MKRYRLLIFALTAAAVAIIAIMVANSMVTPDETISFDPSKPSKFKLSTSRAASSGSGAAKQSSSGKGPAKQPSSKGDKE